MIAQNARVVVGFPAGSSPDVAARLMAEHIKGYAASIIVDNRPGAGGRLPLEALKGAEADGSFMVLTPGDQIALFPHVYARLGYNPLQDFAPVSTVCKVQFLLTVGPLIAADVKTIADFVAWCRANPRLATYGSPGEGTRPHFMTASFARAAGIEMTHVPYKGAPPIVQDLLSGQIASTVSVVSNVLSYVQAGRLRALATTAPNRVSILPEVPTARELGYPTLEGSEWFGVFVPRHTPHAVIAGLSTALRRSLRGDDLRTSLAKQSFEPAGCSPAEFAELIRADGEAWAATVKETGFKPMD